ncbi:MAG: tetratricopeptide repeat protein, partial [Planctomycetota bacterium]
MELRRRKLLKPFRLRALLCLVVGVLPWITPMVSAQSIGRGDLSTDEVSFVRELLGTYNSPDLARVWIDSRLKGASRSAAATLNYFLADVLRVEGDIDSYEAEIQRLAKKYPDHPRSKGAQLEAVLAAMLRLDDANTEAVFATSPGERKRANTRRNEIWVAEIRTILDSNIVLQNREVLACEKRVSEAGDDEERGRCAAELAAKVSVRDLWEFQLLNAIKVYSGMLPDGVDAVQELLEELVILSKSFVDQRYENFGRRYEAQLIYGQALAACGRPEEAASELELLVDIEPSVDPPYEDDVVYFIRRMRIASLSGSLQAYNLAGRPGEGLELIEYLYEEIDPNFPYRKSPEDPDLAAMVATLNIEESISRIAGGDRSTGLSMLQKLIDDFDRPETWKADPGGTREILEQLARGLSRLVDMQVAGLSAEIYTRAAAGFRDRGLPMRAIEAAKFSLAAGHGGKDAASWQAKALYEIGESSDALGRSEEAALAYQFLAQEFPDSEMVAMASQNFFAIVGDLAASKDGAWAEMIPVAEKLFSDNSQGLGSEQLKLQQATEAELAGDYKQARDMFRRVSRTYTDGGVEQNVPFFFRARAAGARCLFRTAEDVEQGIKDASGELLPLLADARKDRDVGGESALRYEMASFYWSDRKKSGPEAVTALLPVLDELQGTNVFREGALLLLLEILAAEGRFVTAEKALTELRQLWPDNNSVVAATYYLIDAYRTSGAENEMQRAGQLVLDWVKLPGAQFAEAEPGVRLGLASILIDGGFAKEAAAILASAQEEAQGTDDPILDIGV